MVISPAAIQCLKESPDYVHGDWTWSFVSGKQRTMSDDESAEREYWLTLGAGIESRQHLGTAIGAALLQGW
jgi:hypothetical protein